MKALYTALIIALYTALYTGTAAGSTVEYLCMDRHGDIDIYVYDITTETPFEMESILYDQCSSIDRLYIGYNN